MNNILSIAKFTLIEAIGNKLLWLTIIIVIAAFGLTEFLGDLAVTDRRQIQVSILASMLRISGVVIIALVVVTSIMRELQDKTLELILSLAVKRSSYLLGKLLGYALVCFILVCIFCLLLMFYADSHVVLIWGVSFYCELLLVTLLCLVMLFTFRQIPAALTVVFLFYTLARSIAVIQLIAENPLVKIQGIGQEFINGFIELLSWILPALHQFSRTDWLVYNGAGLFDLVPVLLQTAIYGILLTSVALFDFYRKNFAT